MQNKHYFFFSFLGIPTFGEGGGGQAGWAKIPTFTKKLFWRLPLLVLERTLKQKLIVDIKVIHIANIIARVNVSMKSPSD